MPTIDDLWIGALLLLTAVWGGVVSYYRRVVAGLTHTWTRAAGEIVTSAGVGLGVGFLCLEAGFSTSWVFAFAGIGGHMGAPLLDFGGEILKSVLSALAARGGGNRPPAP